MPGAAEGEPFAALVRALRDGLVIRCGGRDGRCGKVRAIIEVDGYRITNNPKSCGHRVELFETVRDERRLRPDIAEALLEAEARRRSGPHVLVLRPSLRQRRRSREETVEEHWALFLASGESQSTEEDHFEN
jgi:hypothetical protein